MSSTENKMVKVHIHMQQELLDFCEIGAVSSRCNRAEYIRRVLWDKKDQFEKALEAEKYA